MSFKDQSFKERFKRMGDEAEGRFEQNMDDWVRTGLNRPPFDMTKLSVKTRYTPDYLREDGYYEVQGIGRDQIVKLKEEKLWALSQWNDEEDVFLWLWNNVTETKACVSVDEVLRWVEGGLLEKGMFPEGKSYYKIEASFFRWEPCG